MRPLFVIFLVALLILLAVNVLPFPGTKSVAVVNHMVITLTIFAVLSGGILLILNRPSGRKAFATGTLTPIVCVIFGNTEIYSLLGQVYYSAITEVLQVDAAPVTTLIAGTAVISLASGMLTLVSYQALWPQPESQDDHTAESAGVSMSQVSHKVTS